MKRCPYCDEEIRDSAVKCKHCGSTVGRTPGPGDTLDSARTMMREQLAPGRTLGRLYEIVERLGAGGMGEVCRDGYSPDSRFGSVGFRVVVDLV